VTFGGPVVVDAEGGDDGRAANTDRQSSLTVVEISNVRTRRTPSINSRTTEFNFCSKSSNKDKENEMAIASASGVGHYGAIQMLYYYYYRTTHGRIVPHKRTSLFLKSTEVNRSSTADESGQQVTKLRHYHCSVGVSKCTETEKAIS